MFFLFLFDIRLAGFRVFPPGREPEKEVAMKIIGIISCKIFEDEIVHLVEQDEEVDEVIILKNGSSEDIVRKLEEICVPCRELTLKNVEAHRDLRNNGGDEELILVLNVLEVVGIGRKRTRLKMNIYDAIMRMSLFSDGLLLLYGLCGNVLKDIERDFSYLRCPLVFIRDDEGNVVDDCICATLGGKQAFMEIIKNLRGERSFMLTPMWAANWEKMIVANGFARNLEALEESKMVFKAARYTQVAKINTGLKYQHNFEPRVKEFASFYDLGIKEIKAEQVIFKKSYSEVKNSLIPST